MKDKKQSDAIKWMRREAFGLDPRACPQCGKDKGDAGEGGRLPRAWYLCSSCNDQMKAEYPDNG